MVVSSQAPGRAPTEQGLAEPVRPLGEGSELPPILPRFRVSELQSGGQRCVRQAEAKDLANPEPHDPTKDSNICHWRRSEMHLNSLKPDAQPLKGPPGLEAHPGCRLHNALVDLLYDGSNPSEVFSGPHGLIIPTQGGLPLASFGFGCHEFCQ